MLSSVICAVAAQAAPSPLTPFAKATPVAGARVLSSTPRLSWSASAGAVGYQYCLVTRAWTVVPATTPCDTGWTATTETSVFVGGLVAGRLYGWQVRALDGTGALEADGGVWGSFISASPNVDFNGDRRGDLVYYDLPDSPPGYGIANPSTGTVVVEGPNFAWDSGWSLHLGQFDRDAATDLLLYRPGRWQIKSGNGWSTPEGSDPHGFWSLGWTPQVIDLDGDGISDVFLFNPQTGEWFECLWNPDVEAFTYVQGWWTPGWAIHPVNLNGDLLEDLFLLDRTSGLWFWAINDGAGGFTYPQWGFWSLGWTLSTGDFNGDGLTDLLLVRDGQWCVALVGAMGFSYSWGYWPYGWTPHVVDLDANARSDVFLHDETTGWWLELIGDGGGGFALAGMGQWIRGWIRETDLDGDGRADFIVYDARRTIWYSAVNETLGTLVLTIVGNFKAQGGVILTSQPIR